MGPKAVRSDKSSRRDLAKIFPKISNSNPEPRHIHLLLSVRLWTLWASPNFGKARLVGLSRWLRKGGPKPGPAPGDRAVIGITFGNSNSSIAYTVDDKAEVIANEDGGETIWQLTCAGSLLMLRRPIHRSSDPHDIILC